MKINIKQFFLGVSIFFVFGCLEEENEDFVFDETGEEIPVTSEDIIEDPSLSPLHVEDGFFRDTDNRVVLLHGLNYSHRMKTPPYATWQREEHFEQIAEWGFNVVRYTIFWDGLEPTQGTIDYDYIDRIEEAVAWALKNKIYILIDMHQDLFSPLFGGTGAPAWACIDTIWPNPIHSEYIPWYIHYSNPDVIASFHNLYTDDEMKSYYINIWLEVINRIKSYPNVLGYDLINEPFISPDISFEENTLMPFYNELSVAIEEADSFRKPFIEPFLFLTNLGFQNFLPQPDRSSVYAPHYYSADILSENQSYSGNINSIYSALEKFRDKADEWDSVVFLGEFSAPLNADGALDYISDLLDVLDSLQFSGWAFWNYNPDETSETGYDNMNVLDDNGQPHEVLNSLIRPYPIGLEGYPTDMSFNVTTKKYSLTWISDSNLNSEIFIPNYHYENGINVELSDGAWLYDAELQKLTITTEFSGEHTLHITP